MRRGAFWIAVLGLSVQTATANDGFNQSGFTPQTPTSSSSTSGSHLNGSALTGSSATGSKSPSRYSRPTASSATQDPELKSYYRELFGESNPTDSTIRPAASNTVSGSQLKSDTEVRRSIPAQVGQSDDVRTISSTPLFTSDRLLRSNKSVVGSTPVSKSLSAGPVSPVSATKSVLDDTDIIQADYQSRPGAGSEIQQVQSERFNARPRVQSTPPSQPASPAFNPFSNSQPDAAFPGQTQPSMIDSEVIPTSASRSAARPSREIMNVGNAVQRPANNQILDFSQNDSPFQAQPVTPTADQSRKGDLSSSKTIASAAPAVVVEWQKQADINVGQDCKCYLLVRNSGQSMASQVEVRATFPTTVRLTGAVPQPEKSESYLGWKFEELRPGETKTIEISMIPTERGDINARADVRFSGVANGLFTVSEPMLAVQIEGPRQVMVGEPASHVVTVSNPGTGIANDVKIEALIPDGLEHTKGPKLLMGLGNLNPGESRSVRLALAATKGGHHQVIVQAKADLGLVSSSESEVNVIAPMLATTIEGPGLRYLGRQGVYVMTVSNEGAAATDNVQLRYKVPEGFEFVSADRGAQFDQATGLVTWFIGRLERAEKTEIRATLIARRQGEFQHLARATSEHGTVADAECVTAVEGAASLAISIKDFEDPVEIGARTSYEVKIRNDGTASSKNVSLTCELPEGMNFVSAEGQAEYMVEGQSVLFRSVPDLAAGQSLTFRIHVTAAKSGSMRFRTLLSSDTITEPLVAEEMTRFYGER